MPSSPLRHTDTQTLSDGVSATRKLYPNDVKKLLEAATALLVQLILNFTIINGI